MKIAVFSDLHFEFGKPPKIDCTGADVIVLAGDCHTDQGLIGLVRSLRHQYQVPVICIAGNHEHYNGVYQDTLTFLRREIPAVGGHFLENDTLVLDGIRFLGCTLWTNFMLYGPESQAALMKVADDCITDFWSIRYGLRRFLPADAERLCIQSLQWLERELQQPFEGKTVVITHFAPHHWANHYSHSEGDPVTPYFICDCSYLLDRYPIELWIFGHTHNSIDFEVGKGTRLLSNQAGYPNEDPSYTMFSNELLAEV